MNFKTGDKVRFLNDVGEGVVIKIIDNATLLLKTPDDWEVPALINDLIKIEDGGKSNNYSRNTEKNIQSVKKQEIISDSVNTQYERFFNPGNKFELYDRDDKNVDTISLDIKIYLAFIPVDESNITDCDLEMYLINESNFSLLYSVQTAQNKLYESLPGILEANTKVLLKTFDRQMLHAINTILVQGIFYKDKAHTNKNPVSKEIRLKHSKFHKQGGFTKNDFFYENSIIYTIMDENAMVNEVKKLSKEEIQQIIAKKEAGNRILNQPVISKKNQNPSQQTEVIDLHIQELIDDESVLSNGEIVEIQIDKFKRELDAAIKRKNKSIVFIHGVGNGTLKLELRRRLDHEYKHLQYQDASFAEYGYGATMVLLK